MNLPPKIALAAADCMLARAHLPIKTAHFAKDLGVGMRSLQLAFQRSGGATGPDDWNRTADKGRGAEMGLCFVWRIRPSLPFHLVHRYRMSI
ncbi:hypothetical protein ACIQUB_17595 [Rhizobium sp. NPDC090275]|uniref:hypothetical protein n=1 Tax=Rhizobium sp. NPDC090275 TaxID=3364498 RepID=UPI00383BEE82